MPQVAGVRMIDWERAKQLRAEIGPDDFGEVVAMFLEEADEVIARLSGWRGAKVLESDLHFLKGSALNLGFEQLAALCQDGERRAAAGQTDVDLEAVRGSYSVSRQVFESEFARTFAA